MIETGIYQIINKVNGKSYIGQAVDFNKRKSLHLRQLHNGIHHSIVLQRAWNKYGSDAFEFKMIKDVYDPTTLTPWEQFFIDMVDPEYNICKVAGSTLGVKHTNEAKVKMSQSAKKREPQSRNCKIALLKANTGRPMPEHVKRILSICFSKPIMQFTKDGDFIKEWSSATEVERQLNINHNKISQVCRNIRKSIGGYVWKYKEALNER